LHDKDLSDGFGSVYLPYALARKYPNAPTEWAWQYVFPSSRRSIDPRSGVERRHHFDEKAIQWAVKKLFEQQAFISWPVAIFYYPAFTILPIPVKLSTPLLPVNH